MNTLPVFFTMDNAVQNYAWGSPHAFTELFELANPDQKPQAEIWMGAHPKASSRIEIHGEKQCLNQFVRENPVAVLGQQTSERFGELPFLAKFLAAHQALSIQVHPSKNQAHHGFHKENQQGIALDAPERNYKDPNHKPELVYALTPFLAMNGFRPFDEILELLELINLPAINQLIEQTQAPSNEKGLECFFSALLALEGEAKRTAITQLLAYIDDKQGHALFGLIGDLHLQYPDDIGIFAPLLLNVITLAPGEAMFLEACTPHAHIKGTAIEIMANSDNVLRAGLTPKHIDIDELVTSTLFLPSLKFWLTSRPEVDGCALHYPIPVDDFNFSLYQSPREQAVEVHSAEIVISVDAPVELTHEHGERLVLAKGQSAFIPAYARSYWVSSGGAVARVYC
ncbi:mannose-6-phosphate isomerase, class I [Aliagarivorans taiwanensis]|uniref:mannose-6-phosphate isomerase, class I n=1 Tax=Aliagarivorans taiwanensis TaxID=561966 RepID=UPI00047ABECE|nr:mannose-6-phosphate isomerase, class I [Aliagarivorans taiwanensis]